MVLKDLAEPRKREVACGKMESDEPGGNKVYELMKEVGVSDAVDCGIYRKEYEEKICNISYPTHD